MLPYKLYYTRLILITNFIFQHMDHLAMTEFYLCYECYLILDQICFMSHFLSGVLMNTLKYTFTICIITFMIYI